MSLENKYYYQRFELPQVRFAKANHEDDWEIFLRRIGFDRETDDPNRLLQEHLLDGFSTHLMGNIHWYEKKVVKEKSIRLAYVFVALSLLISIPITVAFIAQTDSVIAEIAVVMAGFFALYQIFNKWLQSCDLIAIYWQTKSNLKSRLYALEDKWYHNETWSNQAVQALATDMQAAVQFGMEAQKVEKQLFFQNYTIQKNLFQRANPNATVIEEELARLTAQADKLSA